MTNTTAQAPKLPREGDRLTWTSPRGTQVEIQNVGHSIYVVRKNGNQVEKFRTEQAARDLARKISNIILEADRAAIEAAKIEEATPYTPKQEAPKPVKAAPTLAETMKNLGGNGQTRIASVAKGSLTKISTSQREALANSIKYCGGRLYRGGKLIVGNIPGAKIALTLSQLYALEKRGYVTLIEENFQIKGGWVTDSCKRALGLA